MWFFLALATALFTASGDAFSKHYLRHFGSPNMALVRVLGPTVCLLPALFFWPWPPLSKKFWLTLALLYPLETIAMLCYMEAIRVSPLSVTVPYLAFTPAFIILTGRVVLGERLSLPGMVGIFMIVLGSYFLHLAEIKKGLLEPFKATFREKGSWLMLLVAFIYSITSVFLKVGINQSERFFFAFFYYSWLGVFMAVVLKIFFRADPKAVLRFCPRGAFLVAASQSAAVVCHVWALSLAPVAYMIAIKRLSVLFGVLIGGVFFKEKAFRVRLLGAIFMVSGVFFIAWAG